MRQECGTDSLVVSHSTSSEQAHMASSAQPSIPRLSARGRYQAHHTIRTPCSASVPFTKLSSSATFTTRTSSASSTFSARHCRMTLLRSISSRSSWRLISTMSSVPKSPATTIVSTLYTRYVSCLPSLIHIHHLQTLRRAQGASLGRCASLRSQGASSPALLLLILPSCSSVTLVSLARPGPCPTSMTAAPSLGPDTGTHMTHHTFMTEYVTTWWYHAPEVMLTFKEYTCTIDMWSVGYMLAGMLSGKPLFLAMTITTNSLLFSTSLGTPSIEDFYAILSSGSREYIRALLFRKKTFSSLFSKANLLVSLCLCSLSSAT